MVGSGRELRQAEKEWQWIEQAIKEERESLKLEILESIKPMLIRAKISKDDAIAALQEYLSSKK